MSHKRLTKSQYEFLADIFCREIRNSRPTKQAALAEVVETLADELAKNDPTFNYALFTLQAGVRFGGYGTYNNDDGSTSQEARINQW